VSKEKQVSLFITLVGSEDYELTHTGKADKSHNGASCRNYTKSLAIAAKCNIIINSKKMTGETLRCT